jgi:hypothetical protein
MDVPRKGGHYVVPAQPLRNTTDIVKRRPTGIVHVSPETGIRCRESYAPQGVRLDNTWITARADVVRCSHPRPVLAAVLEVGDSGEITRNKQELS